MPVRPLKVVLPTLVLVMLSPSALAGINKCVNSEGAVLFSDLPCRDGYTQEEFHILVSQPASTPEEDESESLSESESDPKLDCGQAVANGKEWIDSMKRASSMNRDSGHLSESKYNRGMAAINELEENMNTRTCRKASGNNQRFFACLSDMRNHLASCGKRHNPDF